MPDEMLLLQTEFWTIKTIFISSNFPLMIMNALVYVHKMHTLGILLGGKCQHKKKYTKKNTKKKLLRFSYSKILS